MLRERQPVGPLAQVANLFVYSLGRRLDRGLAREVVLAVQYEVAHGKERDNEEHNQHQRPFDQFEKNRTGFLGQLRLVLRLVLRLRHGITLKKCVSESLWAECYSTRRPLFSGKPPGSKTLHWVVVEENQQPTWHRHPNSEY